MSERLQNIINGINDGSIKFVFDYNLTMEDLFLLRIMMVFIF